MAGSVSRPRLSPVHHGLNLGLTITGGHVQRRAKSTPAPADLYHWLGFACLPCGFDHFSGAPPVSVAGMIERCRGSCLLPQS